MSLNGQYQTNATTVPDGESAVARIDHSRRIIVAGEAGATPIPVSVSGAAGTIVWTQTSVTLNGSSQQALAANTARKGLIVSNRVGNAQMSYSIAGGTVALISGLPLLAGGRDAYTDEATPLTAITVIGTNTQIVDFWEGN